MLVGVRRSGQTFTAVLAVKDVDSNIEGDFLS